MGQYYVIASLEKREYLSPFSINHFSKLREIDYFHSEISLITTKLLQTRWFNTTVVTVGDYYASLHTDLTRLFKNAKRKNSLALRLFLEHISNITNPEFYFYDYICNNFQDVTKIPEVQYAIANIINKRTFLGKIQSRANFLNQTLLLFKDLYLVNFTQKTFLDLYACLKNAINACIKITIELRIKNNLAPQLEENLLRIPNPIFPATLLFDKKDESLSEFYFGDLEVIQSFNLSPLGITTKKPNLNHFKELSNVAILPSDILP